ATLGIFVGLALDLRSPRERRLFWAAEVDRLVTIGTVAGAMFILLTTWQAPIDGPLVSITLALGIAASASSGGAAAANGNIFHRLASHIAELDDVVPIAAAGFVIVAIQGAPVTDIIRFSAFTVLLGVLIGVAG